MIKVNLLLLILLALISCDKVRTNDSKNDLNLDTKFNKMNYLKDKWNQLPNIIHDSNQTAKFEMPVLTVDSNGTLLSEDEMAEITFDSINQRIEYKTELNQIRVWIKKYKDKEALFFLGSSMMSMQHNENTIRCYQEENGKLVDITKDVFPFEKLTKQLFQSKLEDTAFSGLNLQLCLVMRLNKDNSIKINRNDSLVKQLTNVEMPKESDEITLEWSEANGYVIKQN